MIPANEKSPRALPLLSLLREQIERQGSATFTIRGTSMLQLFHKGDSITVTAAAHPVPPGSILVFWHPLEQFLTSHRVLDYNAEAGGYCLKGDNNIRTDPLIPLTMILGQVRLSSDPAWIRALLLYFSRVQTQYSRTLPAGTTPTFGKRIFFALTRRLIWTCGFVQRMLNRNELQPEFEMQPEKHLSKTQKPEHRPKTQKQEHTANLPGRGSAKKADTGIQ
ncbi:MAG: S24/S26 family peptidase [Leptospiraceae bacterium]|nr:S24/S26 family peptidase [Leptospiraceae bacterium]